MNFGEMKNLFLRLLQEADYSGYYDGVFAGQLINQGKDDFESKVAVYIVDTDGDVDVYDSQSKFKNNVVFYNSYNLPSSVVKPLYVYLDDGASIKMLSQISQDVAMLYVKNGQSLSGYYSIENDKLLIYEPPTTNPVWRMKYIGIENDFVLDSDEPKIPSFLHKGIVYSACLIALGTENERNQMIESLYQIELRKAQEWVNNTNLHKEYFLVEDSFENYIENY